MRSDLKRHDLVRVEPAASAEFTASLKAVLIQDPGPIASGWVEAGRPLIVRRFAEGDSRRHVPLGLPLPSFVEGRRRIPVALAPESVAASPAPILAEVRTTAPDGWRSTLDALIALGGRHGLVPRPFGSLLWQALTGLDYLTPASDLDVLWPLVDATDPDRLRGLLDDLARVADMAPMRVDGEIQMRDGGGVQWRELREAPDDGSVLVKYRSRVEMRPVITFRGDPELTAVAGGRP